MQNILRKLEAGDRTEAAVWAVKKGLVERRLDRDAITDAVAAGIIDEAEAATLRLADVATDRVIRVDDFEFDELAAKQLSRRHEDQPVLVSTRRDAPAGQAAE